MPIEFPERFNMADYFLYHNLEEGRENKVCLYFKDQTYTYGETARMSNRVGSALREAGVDIEDRVLIVLPDCPEFVSSQPGVCRAADTHRDDIAIWLFTSGSTGHPKGAVHLQHDLPYNTESFAKRTMGVNENDLTVSVPKLFFGYATGTNLLFPFAVGGATALFAERATPEKMFQVIERYRPTILTTVPTMINSMLNLEPASTRDLSSIRFCYSAGEALPIELYHRWKETFGAKICDGIGSAEMFHIYITNRPGDVKPGSLGRIVEGYEAKIVDGDENEVAIGEMGTLKIKGD